MSTNRSDIRTVLIGSGDSLADLLAALASRSRLLNINLIAVADIGPRTSTNLAKYATDAGVNLIASSMDEIFQLPDVDLVVQTSGDETLARSLREKLPSSTDIIGPESARVFFGLRKMIAENRTLREDSRRLKETRLRLNQFVETATLAIYIKDTDLRYKRINHHALHILGLKESEIIGHSDRSIYPAGGSRWLQQVEQETLRTGKTLHASGVLPLQEQEMHVQVTLFPIIENGRIEGLYGLIEDTTELFESEKRRHQVDEQLNETQKYLREVLENSRDMIFLTDPNGKLLSFNSGAEKALGFKREEVVGTPANVLCASPDSFDFLMATTLREGHATRYEAEFLTKDDRRVICNISLTLIDGPDGKPLEIVCLCRDITTRLRLKNDLIRSERLAAVGQMAAGVAHEINNPLAVIDTIAGLVEEILVDEGGCLKPSSKKILTTAMNRLHHQVKRCTQITHSLLGFVRKSETGMLEVKFSELLDECLNVLGTEIRRSHTTIQRMDQEEIPIFISDPMLLQQVFVNLIKNSIDAIEEVPGHKGVIQIRTNVDTKRVIITIEDNGVGIPANDREKVFNLFHTTKTVGKGTGLGLSIVHDILVRLGGNIRVASEPGKWTRFTVELPLQPPKAPLHDPTSIGL